jgi:nucleotide-binding universal stress UspA family protein
VVSRAEHELGASAARLRELGLDAETHVYYDNPVPAILDASRRQHVDLIVLSTHGRSGLGRVIYGSVADDVLRHAEVPVLLVPSMLDHAWPTDRPLTVLVPLDGSTLSETAIESAGLLAEGLGARLHLLQVLQPPTYPLYGEGYVYIPFDDEAERANARQYLEEQAKKLAARGIEASIEVAVGSPDLVIARTAAEQQADVIAMATHGRGGLARLVLGSVATGTLRRAHVPLLLTRPVGLGQTEPIPSPAPPEAVATP